MMSWHPEYHVHPALAYSQSVIASMPKRTGRSMEEWVRLAADQGPDTEKECRAWLRSEFGLGGTTAMGIASFLHGDGRLKTDPDYYLATAPDLIDAMYSGKKEHLRPIHDAVVRLALGLGDDVKLSPTKTTLPFYRAHVFASLKPATQKRVDLGLCIRQEPPPVSERIVETGGAATGDRITHRIPLSGLDEVDDVVGVALRRAYEEDR